jgi:hypothetical protein
MRRTFLDAPRHRRLFRQGLLCAVFFVAGAGHAQTFKITIEAGKSDLPESPICVPLSLSEKEARFNFAELTDGGKLTGVIGQLTDPGIITSAIAPDGKGMRRRDLHFYMPALKAGAKLTLTCTLDSRETISPAFQWRDNKDGSTTLSWDGDSPKPRPVLRYMHAPYDPSSAERRNKTYKVFHHLYDLKGERPVTNGGHTDPFKDEKKLHFPHHRGIMFAFNKISYGPDLKKSADTWHAKPKDTHQAHEKTLSEEAGWVLGRHRVLIAWHGPDKEIIAHEERELTAYHVGGKTLVEFASRLKTAGGKVKLDGDPQHAGFQFRAANEVADKEIAAQTYYLRPWGKGDPGKEANWPGEKRQVNLPWHVLSFVLGKTRYSVAYLDHPSNPGEKRYSERSYGRFGCYFEHELTEERPLVLNHRLWLQEGDMTAAQAQGLRDAFAEPGRVTVSRSK